MIPVYTSDEENHHVGGWLAYHARFTPNNPAFTFVPHQEKHPQKPEKNNSSSAQTMSWSQLHGAANRVWSLLSSHGVRQGDHIAMVMQNSRACYTLYLALMQAGCVAVPLSPLLSTKTIALLANNADCSHCVRDDKVALPHSVFKTTFRTSELEHAIDDVANTHASRSPQLAKKILSSDLCHIMFSSGTTGVPKGISLTHLTRFRYGFTYSYVFNIRSSRNAIGGGKKIADEKSNGTSSSVVMHSGSLVFNGAFVTLLAALFSGTHYVLMEQFSAVSWLQTATHYAVTHCILVPSIIFQILHHPQFGQYEISLSRHMQCMISVGAPLPLPTKQLLQQRLPGVLNELYGTTEGFSTVLWNADAVSENLLDSVGRPMPFCDLRIVDPTTGKECPTGVVGEIHGRSPLIFSGYYKQAQATRDSMDPTTHYMKTGDLGRVDEKGFLFLAGRKKDMLISGGVNVYPADIERVAQEHPLVSECGVFGVADEKWGERPVAAVVLRETEASLNATSGQLKDWINDHVNAKYEKVVDVLILKPNEMPRNVAGKILKSDLFELYQSRQTAPPKSKL